MTMADIRPSDKATAPRQQSERDRLAAIRAARRDLISVPAMPVTRIVIQGLEEYKKCAGCSQRVRGAAFCDDRGWLWCQACAGMTGAAFTDAEVVALFAKLSGAADAASGDLAAEMRALRDELLPDWTYGRATVPNPYGLAF